MIYGCKITEIFCIGRFERFTELRDLKIHKFERFERFERFEDLRDSEIIRVVVWVCVQLCCIFAAQFSGGCGVIGSRARLRIWFRKE